MDVTKFPEFDNHELVSLVTNKAAGLRGVIAIHNTNRGPAAGATRYWHYASEELAIRDALRLSRGMTYKCALAGLPFGGGKGVIIASRRNNKAAILRAYAKEINLLRGSFYTGEDVGMTKRDVETMGKVSRYVIGRSKRDGRPAYWTALGVLWTMERLGKHVWGKEGIAGRTVAIRGLGKVGLALAEFVAKAGGQVIGADIDPARVKLARARVRDVKIVSHREIHRVQTDVFAPCALGGEFNAQSVRELKCDMVCGGANNQLTTAADGTRLFRRNILYVPDYLVNSGGLIDVVAELDPRGVDVARIGRKVREIPKTAERIVRLSEKRRRPTNIIADRLAEKRFLRE